MSEARTEGRLDRLEETLARLEPMLVRVDERLQYVASAVAVARIEAQFPHLATKADLTTGLSGLQSEIIAVKVALAGKPGKVWLTTAIGLLLVAYTVGLVGLVALPVITGLVQ
jgi:hypothetical protein